MENSLFLAGLRWARKRLWSRVSVSAVDWREEKEGIFLFALAYVGSRERILMDVLLSTVLTSKSVFWA